MNTKLIPVIALNLIHEIQDSGYEAYLVGGCVRDMMLNNEPNDWDICTNALPEQTIEILKNNGRKFHTVGIEFGTVTAMCNSAEFEITTYRADGNYTDNRRPDAVKYQSDIREDLKRRDFTINAMAYDPINKELIDLFNGLDDLDNCIIRTVGEPDVRFEEDALRILRALRFAITLDFDISLDTLAEMERKVELLDKISKERITSELEKILTSGKKVRKWFMRCKYIIKQIIPELECCFHFNQNNKYHTHDVYEHILYVVDNCKSNKFEIKLSALLHDVGKPEAYVEDELGQGHFYGHPEISYRITKDILNKRMRLTTEQSERVLNLVFYHDMTIAKTRPSIKRALNKHGLDMLNDWFILKQADMDDHIYPNKEHKYFIDIPVIMEVINSIIEEQSCFSLKDLDINGNQIMKELGLKPGKQIGIILNTLLEEVIDEKIINDNKVLLARAQEIIV